MDEKNMFTCPRIQFKRWAFVGRLNYLSITKQLRISSTC